MAGVPVGVRDRLVRAADQLFYSEGIHAVGVDRVLAEAGVAKASLYHHFAGKDDLVVAYLDARSAGSVDSLRRRVGASGQGARGRMDLVFAGIWAGAADARFHGCPFINAAAEYPDPDHPVRRAVARHRQRFAALLGEQLDQGGRPAHQSLVQALVVLYDGCMVSAQLEPIAVTRSAASRALDALLAG